MRYIGGDRLDWDSRSGTSRPDTSSLVVDEVVRYLVKPATRVLIVGHGDEQLLQQLLDLNCFVQFISPSVDYVTALDESLRAYSQLELISGDVARLSVDDPFDLVVVASGWIGAASPDSKIQNESQLIAHLSSFVGADGVLLYACPNPFGVREIVGGYDVEHSKFADVYWPTGTDVRREASIHEIRDQFVANGFIAVNEAYLFGGIEQSSVMASRAALEVGQLDEYLQNSMARAVERIFDGEPVLAHPYLVTRRIIRAKSGAKLAPAVLFVAQRKRTELVRLPEAMVAEASPFNEPKTVWRLDGLGQERTWAQAEAVTDNETAFSVALRTTQILPCENSLQTLLLEAAQNIDRATFVELLSDYASALMSEAVVDSDVPYFALSNVARFEGNVYMIARNRKFEGDVDRPAALHMHLRRLAELVLSSSQHHFWSAGISVDQLVVRLGAMVSIDLKASGSAASSLYSKIELYSGNTDDEELAKVADALSQEMMVPYGPGGPISVVYQERINTQLRVEKLMGRVAQLEGVSSAKTEGQRRKNEQQKQQRSEIKRLRSEIKKLRSEVQDQRNHYKTSNSYRFGHALLTPFRLIKQLFHKP